MSASAAGQRPGRQSAEEQAAELFARAGDHYEAGELEEAVELLLRARELHADPAMLYNLARAYEGLGELDEALTSYEGYLREEDEPRAPGAIEQRIASLREQIAEREALAEREAELERERRRRREEPPPVAGSGPWPWVVLGVGAAGLVAGGAFGVLALVRRDDADAADSNLASVETFDEAQTFATVSTVALIAGGAVAAGGLVWVIVDAASSDGAEHVALVPTGAGLALRGGW